MSASITEIQMIEWLKQNYPNLVEEFQEQAQTQKPVMLEYPDLTQLRKNVEKYMDEVQKARDGEDFYIDDDWPHWIFEEVMNAFYGKGVWAWINESRR